MRGLAAALVMAWACALPGLAQEMRALPVDEGSRDAGFAAYRAALLDAVVRRDIEAVLAAVGPDIHLSFGGDAGREAMRARLIVDPMTLSEEFRHEAPGMRERYWAELETVLRLGGRFEEDGSVFAAPYTWTVEIPPDHDPFSTYFVTGEGVALRDRPIRFGEVIRWLDHDVVTQLEGGDGTDYRRVRLQDGTEGFAHRDYLRSQVGYRAIFARQGAGWRMTTFIAGD